MKIHNLQNFGECSRPTNLKKKISAVSRNFPDDLILEISFVNYDCNLYAYEYDYESTSVSRIHTQIKQASLPPVCHSLSDDSVAQNHFP